MSLPRVALAIFVLLCAAAVGPMSAQGARSLVGGGAGLVQPLGSFGDVENVGWHVFGTAVLNVRPGWAVTLDAVFGQVGHEGGVAGHSRMVGATANVARFLAQLFRQLQGEVACVITVLCGFRAFQHYARSDMLRSACFECRGQQVGKISPRVRWCRFLHGAVGTMVRTRVGRGITGGML